LLDTADWAAIYEDTRAVCTIQKKGREANLESLVFPRVPVDFSLLSPFSDG
jgi:hypothetical protein